MKNSIILILLCFTSFSAWAQLTNNGATIVVEQGAALIMEGAILNQNSGNITNSGKLIVEGDLENLGTITSTASTAVLSFRGGSNSVFTVGNTNLGKLENDKTDADINLVGDLTIQNSIDFSPGVNTKINIDDADLTLLPAATILQSSPQNYITTNGTGFLIKKVDQAGSFTFPVGNANGRTKLTSDFTGSFNSNSSIKVKVNPIAASNLPADVTDFINRNWEVVATNISSYQNEVEAEYLATDLTGQAALAKGASYDGSEWSYKDAGQTNNMVESTIEAATSTFTGSNFFGELDPQVFLQASYSGAGLMSTDLAGAGLIPLNSPYADAPATAVAIPADAVDWVKIELRDQNDPAVVKAKKSAFLLSDGSVVDLDGTSLPTIKDAPTKSFVAIYHRNHLPIRTSTIYDLSAPALLDFSSLANVYNNPSITTNSAMKLLEGSTSGMWSGDANGNNTVSYNGGSNDRTSILLKVGFTTPNNTIAGYFKEDINMDGIVSYNGGANDRTPILLNINFTTPNNTLSAHID